LQLGAVPAGSCDHVQQVLEVVRRGRPRKTYYIDVVLYNYSKIL
jgi:hypothetical protein